MSELARKLRKSSTDAELQLWQRLKNRALCGYKFRRQHPLPPYIADFVCLERMLVVELDGGQHVEQADSDAVRTACLEAKDYKVIRFWNDDVLRQMDVVMEEILRQLESRPSPPPSPRRKRGEGVP